jgi:DNA-binding response OmpR family regulator
MLRALRREDYSLILVESDDLAAEDAGIYSWLNCRTGESTPVVLLTSVHNPYDIARALNAGADACIEQPFEPVELIARLHAVLRRANKTSVRRTISVSGFTLDKEAGLLLDRGAPVPLTPREFTMAWLFFSSPGIYMSRDTISKAIWGVDSEIASRTIEQHVYKLRKKLNLTAERGAVIRTTYTKGYCLQLTHDTEQTTPGEGKGSAPAELRGEVLKLAA